MFKGKKNSKSSRKYSFLPIILMTGFVPLIVFYYQYNTNLSQFSWYPNGAEARGDFFFGWKMIALSTIGIVMAIILFYRNVIRKEEIRFETGFYFLLGYLLFVIMSALFSNYKYWVVFGTYELLEPVWVVLAYILLCFYIYQYVQTEQHIYFTIFSSCIGITIMTVIGVFQRLGLDLFQSSFGKHLITPPGKWGQLESIHFCLGDKVSYCTLYNPNFLSLYFGLLIPVMIAIVLAVKKMWQRILFLVLTMGCFICLIGSQSDSGWMALFIGCITTALILLSRNKKWFIRIIPVTILAVVLGGVILMTNPVGEKIMTTILGTYHMTDKYSLWGIETDEECLRMDVNGDQLAISYQPLEDASIEIQCTDESGTILPLQISNEESYEYIIDDPRFQDVIIKPVLYSEDVPAVEITIDEHAWDFIRLEEGGYYYINPANKFVKYPQIASADLFNEDTFSGRGHIWNMTLPLLMKHLVMGSGANTYLFEYPQEDYMGQIYIYGPNSYEVKAHCWYLQQCIETGVIGTIFLLLFLGMYIYQSIILYRKVKLHEPVCLLGLGLFTGNVVYMIAAFANDSNVCTAPVFWGCLGLGMAVNRLLREKMKENKL